MKRSLIALLTLAVLALAALPAAGTAATRTHGCPQSDPANGLGALRAGGLSCKKAFGVAKRTNSVKCFLNGDRCTHVYKGRSWTCKLTDGGNTMRVTCGSRGKLVKYRLG